MCPHSIYQTYLDFTINSLKEDSSSSEDAEDESDDLDDDLTPPLLDD